MMYEWGRTVARDSERALAYYHVGCDRQNAEACTNAGILLITAHPSNTDNGLRAALQLLHKGCDGGDQRACQLLADTSSVASIW
jgi:TPR repeat protein